MIELKSVCKTFNDAGGVVDALSNINLTIHDGDVYGIIGMSGAGKSTLVRCINLLERPTEGEILINGVNFCNLSQKELREARSKVTMIFQGFNLLMQKNCLDNICFPLLLRHVPKKEAVAKAKELLEMVGLPDKEKAYPAQLSGGQKQRIAIARALATNPDILLCDEATSALDPSTTHQILSLIRDVNKRLGITVVIITHQMSVVEEVCNRVAILDKGTVAEEGEVSEVFANPQSSAARRLVYPDENEVNPICNKGERLLRIIFNGEKPTSEPIISAMAIEKGIKANILHASTRLLDGKLYGNMILGVPDDEQIVNEAKTYLARACSHILEVKNAESEETSI